MPAHAQSQSQVEEVLSLLKRRIWQILLPAVLTCSVGVMLATLLPRKYWTNTRLELVDQTIPLKQAGVESPSFASEVFAAQYQVRSFERVRRVLESLQWEEFETLPPDAQYTYIQRVIADIGVKPTEVQKTKTLFLDINYEDTDPNHAAQFLNELRRVYVAEKLDALRAQSVQLRDQMYAEVQKDTEAYTKALEANEELQRMHGLAPTQQAPGGGRERPTDPIVQQRNAAQTELSKAEAELKKAQSALSKVNAQLEAQPATVPAEDPVAADNLTKRLSEIQADIDEQKDIQRGKTHQHSQFQTAQKKIEDLEELRTELLQREKEPAPEARRIPNPKRPQLVEQLAALEVEIAGHEGRIAQLSSEVTRLHESVEARTEAARRLRELDDQLEGAVRALAESTKAHATQQRLAEVLLAKEFTPFEVTEYAFPPASPTSPNVPLVIGTAAALGLVLGVVFALLAEFGRNAFRGPVDLGNVLPIPVLGVINEIATAAERRAQSLRRTLVGTTTVALALAVLWITYAYQEHPTLLGPEVVGFLDDVRESLR